MRHVVAYVVSKVRAESVCQRVEGKDMIKTTKVPVTEMKEQNEFACDLCGCYMPENRKSTRNSATGSEEDEVLFEAWTWEDKWNDDYRENKNNMYVDQLDCCIDCFTDKVKPLIEKTFNVKFRKREM